MPEEALREIFGPTMHLKIVCNDELLDTEKKRNQRFFLFDEWHIVGEDAKPLNEDERERLKKYFALTLLSSFPPNDRVMLLYSPFSTVP